MSIPGASAKSGEAYLEAEDVSNDDLFQKLLPDLFKGVGMTLEEFKSLKPGQQLYDARQSKRYHRHIFAMVQGYGKATGELLIRCEGVEEAVEMTDHLMWDKFDPEDGDISTLPFY